MKTKTVKKAKAKLKQDLGTFVKVKAGTFLMGSPLSEDNRSSDETQHAVTISRSFEICATQVTQKQWAAVMGSNPSPFKGDNRPVETVSWFDCQEFISKLNRSQKTYVYRLPTEAEWEFACRGGTQTAYSFMDPSSLHEYSWSYSNSDGKTSDVGMLKPNPIGLYDMHGNVWEWCQDWYGPYNTSNDHNPTGPSSGSFRVFRGGSWGNDAQYLRSAYRGYNVPSARYYSLGFRLVRTSP